MYSFLRMFGMTLGVGLGGSIFQNVMKQKLVQLNLPTSIARNAEAYIQVLRTMPQSSEKDNILAAYVYGFRGVYTFYTAIAGAAFVVTLFIKHYSMDKELQTEHHLQENWISRMAQQYESSQSGRPASQKSAMISLNENSTQDPPRPAMAQQQQKHPQLQ